MKNKKFVIFLIVCTILIWGSIVYKIINPSGKIPEITTDKVVIQNRKVNKLESDTFEINFDSRDPFLNIYYKKKKAGSGCGNKRTSQRNNSTDANYFFYTAFQYKGIIQSKKEVFALLLYQSEYYTVKKGDQIDKFKIISIANDSVVIAINKIKFPVKK